MWRNLKILAGEPVLSPAIEPVDVSKGISTLLWGLALIAGVPIAFLLGRKILNNIAVKRMKSYEEDLRREASEHEKAGKFVSAGLVYEKLKDPERAAPLYARGKDFGRAAQLYEALIEPLKAKEMYEAMGEREKAAEAALSGSEFAEAARLYKQAGRTDKAAEALEAGGSLLAAAREHREAGNYARAAELLKEGGMPKEAAEMYRIALTETGEIDKSNLDRHYAFVSFLEAAEDEEEAMAVLEKISAIDPDYRDVRERLGGQNASRPQTSEPTRGLKPPAGPPLPMAGKSAESLLESHRHTEEALKRETTLRSMMSAGKMEPRYAMRLWVSVLKALAQKHKEGVCPGGLDPEGIFVDSENNVRFSDTGCARPDEAPDIYSMGVILYEMLTGGLECLNTKKPSELAPEVPPWLDEIALRCINKDMAERFKDFDEIFSALRELTKKSE